MMPNIERALMDTAMTISRKAETNIWTVSAISDGTKYTRKAIKHFLLSLCRLRITPARFATTIKTIGTVRTGYQGPRTN